MKPKLAITLGDPNGIGPEIVIKALSIHPEIYNICQPIVFGDRDILQQAAKTVQIDVKIQKVAGFKNLDTAAGRIDCFHIQPLPFSTTPGKLSAEAGKHAFAYISSAVEQAMQGNIDAIVTAPINKEALKLANVPFLDHTEILTKMTNSENTMTLFVTGNLRVFFYSRHISFREIADSLDKNNLVETLTNCDRYLREIGVSDPKIALAALNPHGGEKGMFGNEEIEILQPSVQIACERGLDVEGPIPADSVFHLAKEGRYDAVLSLYHDQGHIAAKTYDFYRTVSLTMGLPFLRTSVDHGTGFDIAGKGIANETSMVEAIKAARKYFRPLRD